MKKSKKKSKKSWAEKLFYLTWRRLWIIIVGWFVAVLLHNAFYALGIYFGGENFWGQGGDEPVFFIIAVIVMPIYFIISLGYTFYKTMVGRSIND